MEQFVPESSVLSFFIPKKLKACSLKAKRTTFPPRLNPSTEHRPEQAERYETDWLAEKVPSRCRHSRVHDLLSTFGRRAPIGANTPCRNWLYQTPEQILLKASNGASDFGNKFGQPLICGSVLTFEHTENEKIWIR